MIPEDWEVKTLGEVGRPVIGLTYSPRDVREAGTLVLRSSNVQNGALAFNNNVFVDPSVATKALVNENDILICVRNGSRELIGKCAKVDYRANGMAFGAFMSVFRTRDHGFIFHQFRSDLLRRQINEHLGATINQITNGSLNGFNVVWPPDKNERERIAEALSDVDEAIAAVEAVMAKKRTLKTATMQALLSGTCRLPGYSGAWETKALGDVATAIGGATPSTTVQAYWDGGIPWCTPTDLTCEPSNTLCRTARTITEAGLAASATRLLPKGALLLCTRASVGEIKIAGVPMCTNQGFKGLVCNASNSNLFLFYLLSTMADILRDRSSGSTFLEISKKDLVSIEMQIPSLEEQQEIALFLAELDDDLGCHASKLAKLRRLKTAMMQQLLTGKIRLV